MNHRQRLEYWLTFHRFQQSREKRYGPVIARVLTAQKKEFIEQYKQGNSAIVLSAAPLKKVIESLYFDAAITFGAKVLATIRKSRITQKARMPMGFNARMQQLIEQYYGVDFLNLSEGITDTTRDLLNRVLVQAHADGLGFDDIIKQLEGTELSKARSRLIARTETVTAANSGAYLSAKESGILVKKVWIYTHDARTRHEHIIPEKPIDIDEPFEVMMKGTVYLMMHPGDRGGKEGRLRVPGKLVCNCRCVCGHIPQRDRAGRVITV